MSLSTLFALSCASSIVFGNLLVNRLNVNDSDSVLSEFETEARRLLGVPGSMDFVIINPGIFEWPICTQWDQVEHRCTKKIERCPFNSYEWCHQIRGGVYRAGGKCYLALTNCMGCMKSPETHAGALKPVDCAKYGWFGYPVVGHSMNGRQDHQLDSVRQFVYKICVRSGSLIDGIKFYYKTPKDASNSEFIFTESPWYGGRGGIETCWGGGGWSSSRSFIDHIEVKSESYSNTIRSITLSHLGEAITFGGVGSDVSQSVSVKGGVLRSVEVIHGYNPIAKINVINALKFNWMDGVADDMIYEAHCNGGFDC